MFAIPVATRSATSGDRWPCIEEAINYLLLGKGEVVALSHKVEHSMLTYEPLAKGRIPCIVPENHSLARRSQVSAAEIAKYR